MISEFSEVVWNLMPAHKNGFVIFDKVTESVVPQKIVEFKAKKAAETPAEIPVVEVIVQKGDAAANMDVMREYLKEKGVKFHHLIGYDKLKKLYDDNQE